MDDHQSAVKMHDQSEMGLSFDDLMPLTQPLISPELAFAFGINPEPPRTPVDLNRAVHDTYSTICPREDHDFEPLRLFPTPDSGAKPKKVDSTNGLTEDGSKEDPGGDDNGLGRAIKRPRLVWTPQLHKRFVDVIEHLGIDKAVPKTIMEMMNVEGLTRENVASHLQKYRLYLKRMDGINGGDQSHSNPRRLPTLMDCDGFGAATPMPPQQPPPQPPPLHGTPMSLMPMPPMGGPPAGPHGFGHLGFPAVSSDSPGYCGLEFGPFNMLWNQQRG